MIETEFIKSMNLNFERIKLEKKPEEKKYQYCIVTRGGIRGVLECSLRYINSDAFLYYNITSKQNLSQIMYKKKVDRQWLKDFAWNLNHIKQEISRFLLSDSHIIWYPEQVYRDLDENRWSFIYYPYYEGDNGFSRFMEFVIEKLDYDDEKLVECVYKIYESYEKYGETYLKEKIFEDIKWLDKKQNRKKAAEEIFDETVSTASTEQSSSDDEADEYEQADGSFSQKDNLKSRQDNVFDESADNDERESAQSVRGQKKGLLAFLEGARKRDKEVRKKARRENHYAMEIEKLLKVAEEEDEYGDEQGGENTESTYGKTVYIEKVAEAKDIKKRLYNEAGEVLFVLGEDPIVIGKKKDETDLVVEDETVSRVHARIAYEDNGYMLADLNATNGTFKNGMRLKPYEKRRLVSGDEIRLGSFVMIYR
ncbi:MAG: FHA domain-containing protein [Lachnospiraceae bacterium]|nr:FHA domain-containing protein [Lachnospiraceae bacterium]